MALTRAFLNGVNYDDVNNLTKPIIINGDMNISQRYTSKTSITSATKLADRWLLNIGSSGTHTYSQGTGPGTFGLTKCIKIDCTSANASGSDADANMYISTALEGHDVQLFRKGTSDAKAFTISFFVRPFSLMLMHFCNNLNLDFIKYNMELLEKLIRSKFFNKFIDS